MSLATPLYVVEELGEWRMEVYEDYIITVDHFEGFAEVVFIPHL